MRTDAIMTDSLVRIAFIEKDIIIRRGLCPPNKVYNKVMAYLRRCLALLSALMLSLSAYAASMEFSISPSIDVADYIASAEGVTDVDLSVDVAKGFAVSAGIFGDIYPWLSAGGVAYADVRSLINEDGALITIPFMAALRFRAGGHAQIAGSYVKFGPAFALSAGISIKLTENFFLDISTWFSLMMQLSDDGRTAYEIVSRPIALGVRAKF